MFSVTRTVIPLNRVNVGRRLIVEIVFVSIIMSEGVHC